MVAILSASFLKPPLAVTPRSIPRAVGVDASLLIDALADSTQLGIALGHLDALQRVVVASAKSATESTALTAALPHHVSRPNGDTADAGRDDDC
jgi:hypothetical protein